MGPDTVIAGRYRVLCEAPAPPRVGRVRLVDEQTGNPLEGLYLRPIGAASAAVRAAFERQHRQLHRVAAPGLVRTVGLLEHAGGLVVLREPLEDPTLAEIDSIADAPTLAGIGARLLPAIVAAGPGAGGTLTAHDIGIDSQGMPVLAPLGQPMDRVTPSLAAHAPPEAFAGAPADGASALYGLGAVLYRLGAGRSPEPIGPDRVIAPPSSFRVELGTRIDEAIALLLNPDPMARAGALPRLTDVAGPVPDLRERIRPPVDSTAGTVRTTRAGQAGARALVDERASVAASYVPLTTLTQLDGRERSRLAGALAVSVRTLDALVAERRELVLQRYTSARGATDDARDRAEQLGLLVEVSSGPGLWRPAASALLVGGGGIIGLVGLLTLLLPLLAGTAVAWVSAVALLFSWVRARSRHQALVDSPPLPAPPPSLRRPWARLARARVQLADANIPEAAAGDLRSALTDVERHLEELAQIDATISATLAGVDAAELQQRLRKLTVQAEHAPSRTAERDRVARSLDDLAALQHRHQQLRDDVRRVDGAIDELTTTLGGLMADDLPDAVALANLQRTTQLARAALDPAATEPPPPLRTEEP